MTITALFFAALAIGIGATVVMDVWSLILKRLGVATLDFAMVGRWAGHLPKRRFKHTAIAKAEPVRHERWVGWVIHYAVGVMFAVVFVAVMGTGWLLGPTLWQALVAGGVTVAAPLCILQPAMGAGFFACKSQTPLVNCIKSLVTHLVFGAGLFLSAQVLAGLIRQISVGP